jgi:hypothetical protein
VAGAVRIFTLTRNLFARITIEEDSRREWLSTWLMVLLREMGKSRGAETPPCRQLAPLSGGVAIPIRPPMFCLNQARNRQERRPQLVSSHAACKFSLKLGVNRDSARRNSPVQYRELSVRRWHGRPNDPSKQPGCEPHGTARVYHYPRVCRLCISGILTRSMVSQDERRMVGRHMGSRNHHY